MRTVVLLLDNDPILSKDFLQEMQKRNVIVKAFSLASVADIITKCSTDNVIFTMNVSDKKGISLVKLLTQEIECFTTIIRFPPENRNSIFKLTNLIKADYFVYHQMGMQELVIRIDTILSRMKLMFPQEEEAIAIGDYIYHTSRYTLVSPSGKTEQLTEKEARIFTFICQRPRKLIDYDNILLNVWGESSELTKRSLQVFVFHLKKKFSEDQRISLNIVSGLGLVFKISDKLSRQESSDKSSSRKIRLNKRNVQLFLNDANFTETLKKTNQAFKSEPILFSINQHLVYDPIIKQFKKIQLGKTAKINKKLSNLLYLLCYNKLQSTPLKWDNESGCIEGTNMTLDDFELDSYIEKLANMNIKLVKTDNNVLKLTATITS